MLTETQERRLESALAVLVEMAPSGSDLMVPEHRRPRRAGLAAVIGFGAVVAVSVPIFLFASGSSTPGTTVEPLSPTTSDGAPTTTPTTAETGISFAAPEQATSPGNLWSLVASDDALYATVLSPNTDQVVQSTDGGVTWEVVLEAEPGDGEGLFAVGDVVVHVIQDDNPARDTVVQGSVVTKAPRVLVFDPATGESWEAQLPRPHDPPMEALSERGGGDCPLFGYQSWINAHAVAVGERLVVGGNHELVGRLVDGTELCASERYTYLTWVSDDAGRTWQMHEGPPLWSLAWSGEQFVALSTQVVGGPGDQMPDTILTSEDGVEWTQSPVTFDVAEGSFPGAAGVVGKNGTVVAWLGIDEWADQDLGVTRPVSAIVAISIDHGATWTTTSITEPVTAVALVGNTLVGLVSYFGDVALPDERSSLLTSIDGVSWTSALDLPEFGYGPRRFVATEDAIYMLGESSGTLWRIPAS